MQYIGNDKYIISFNNGEMELVKEELCDAIRNISKYDKEDSLLDLDLNGEEISKNIISNIELDYQDTFEEINEISSDLKIDLKKMLSVAIKEGILKAEEIVENKYISIEKY